MKIVYKLYCTILFSVVLIGCGGNYKEYKTSALKIVTMDSLEVESLNDENRLPERIRELCDVLALEEKESVQAFVFEPTLNRIDLGQELSLKTDVKTFSGNKNNPKVLSKHIKKNFEEVIVAPEFISAKAGIRGAKLSEILGDFLSNSLKKDTLIIFSENESAFRVGGNSYKTYSDIDEIRKYILSVLKKNSKASFCILWNPNLSGASQEGKGMTVNKTTSQFKKELSISKHEKVQYGRVEDARTNEVEEKAIVMPSSTRQKWSGENTTRNEALNNTISREDIKSK